MVWIVRLGVAVLRPYFRVDAGTAFAYPLLSRVSVAERLSHFDHDVGDNVGGLVPAVGAIA